jgi:hypothetical protein
MGGKISGNPRAAVDFAVPFSPRIKTPPDRGLTAAIKRACFKVSCPTKATKG